MLCVSGSASEPRATSARDHVQGPSSARGRAPRRAAAAQPMHCHQLRLASLRGDFSRFQMLVPLPFRMGTSMKRGHSSQICECWVAGGGGGGVEFSPENNIAFILGHCLLSPQELLHRRRTSRSGPPSKGSAEPTPRPALGSGICTASQAQGREARAVK